MKKLCALLLTAAMVFSMTACGNDGGGDKQTSAGADKQQESAPAQEESAAPAPAETTAPAST